MSEGEMPAGRARVMNVDNLRRVRFDLDQSRAAWAETFWRDTPASGSPALLVQVYQQTSLPTKTGVFFACHPATVLGSETEGKGGTFTVNTSATVEVYVIGSLAPSAGDYLVARFVADRWVAERMGPPPGPVTTTIPGCPCPAIPLTLYVSSSDPTKNRGLFANDTLIYGPKPSWLTNQVGNAPGFYGQTTFTDSQGGPPYVYYFWCFSGSYRLDRAFRTDPPYGPFRSTGLYGGIDSTRGCQYPVNGRANSCTGDAFPGFPPSGFTFSMTSGILPGGFDPTQQVLVQG